MKSPEELENCSTGFAFAVQVDDAKVLIMDNKSF